MSNGTDVRHGALGTHSRYKVIQHKYVGYDGDNDGGYVELLEIPHAPTGHASFVIHQYNDVSRCAYTEWRTLADALAAWDTGFVSMEQRYPALPGFINHVPYSKEAPWFYARSSKRKTS
jgi:hypothetical protein